MCEKYSALVFATAYRRTGDRGGSEEISQNVFTILARKARTLTHTVPLGRWLHRTTLLEARNWLQQTNRRLRKMKALGEFQQCGTTEEELELQEVREVLDEAIDKLPANDRRVILLRFFDGLSIREIASVIGKSEAASQKQQHRALQKLSSALTRKGVRVSLTALALQAALRTSEAVPLETVRSISMTALSGASSITKAKLLSNTILTMNYGKTILTYTASVAAAATIAIPIMALAGEEEEKGSAPKVAQNIGPLSPFVRRISQDKSGNLWFGTNGDGVIRYGGDAPEYFSIDTGLGGVAVRGIVEDKDGNIWFGTEGGITKYDGDSFTNFTEKDGLVNSDVWSILVDSKGTIWIGTLQGVSRFDGKEFTPFTIPEVEPDHSRGISSSKMVHCIMEDRQGKMWFGTSGGAFVYDGTSFTNITEKEGLCNNTVNCILEDQSGSIWFATHHKGVCRFDGTSFTHITSKDGVNGTEAWDLYEDRSGNIWFPIENSGVYRYDGRSFTNFQKEHGLTSNAIQCTFEDKEGRLWLGGWKGLFRYDGKSIFTVGKNGPWQ